VQSNALGDACSDDWLQNSLQKVDQPIIYYLDLLSRYFGEAVIFVKSRVLQRLKSLREAIFKQNQDIPTRHEFFVIFQNLVGLNW